MKKEILTLITLLFICTTAMFAQEWETDFEKAKKIASDEGKTIIMVFQGSDWCAPCMKLDKEIWNSEAFKKYAKDNFVMLQLDFPRRRNNALSEAQAKANAELAEKYNKRGGFPFVVILNSKGKVLGETGYLKLTPENYIAKLNSFIN